MRRRLFLICSIGVLLRVASFLVSQNAGGDALARAELTARWLQHPSLQMHFDVWLPIHFWLIAATSIVVNNVELAARVLSLVLGIFSIPLVWWLTKEIDGSDAAILSTTIFCFYTLQIAYSVTSSCDVPYAFFLILGLALFFYGRRSTLIWALCCGAIALTLAAGIRYEAWIIIFALDIVLVYRREFANLLVFAPLSAIWPVFWMIYEWRTRGNPLYAPTLNHAWVAKDVHTYAVSMLYRLALPLGVVLITLTPLAIVGAARALRLSVEKNPALREFVFVTLFFAALQLYQILSGGTMSYARYTLTIGTLIAVLSGIGLQYMIRKEVIIPILAANLILLTVLSFSHSSVENKARSVAPIMRYRRYLEETGLYLRSHGQLNDAVVIDSYNYESGQLAHLAGYPLLANDKEFLVLDGLNPQKQSAQIAQLSSFVERYTPTYFVYSPNGELRTYLSFPAECSSVRIANAQYECAFHNTDYHVYRIAIPAIRTALR